MTIDNQTGYKFPDWEGLVDILYKEFDEGGTRYGTNLVVLKKYNPYGNYVNLLADGYKFTLFL